MSNLFKISTQALWSNNPALIQVLGLCPLLAVTNSTVNALGLSLATLMVITGSNIAVSVIRNIIHPAVRLPIFVMIIAALTTCAEIIMQAYTYHLYTVIGIFIPLIVTNCMILGRAEAFASRNNIRLSSLDGLMTGIGFAWVLIILGMLREIIGSGTLFANFELIFGESAKHWEITVFNNFDGFVLAILPPGAFIALGLIIALQKYIDNTYTKWRLANTHIQKGTKRVRVTENRA
jgi:Na+-translocating ferredoxin:NAD+ oxidoreductase subunit E